MANSLWTFPSSNFRNEHFLCPQLQLTYRSCAKAHFFLTTEGNWRITLLSWRFLFIPFLTGFPEFSPEELHLEYYNCRANNNIQDYVSILKMLTFNMNASGDGVWFYSSDGNSWLVSLPNSLRDYQNAKIVLNYGAPSRIQKELLVCMLASCFCLGSQAKTVRSELLKQVTWMSRHISSYKKGWQ